MLLQLYIYSALIGISLSIFLISIFYNSLRTIQSWTFISLRLSIYLTMAFYLIIYLCPFFYVFIYEYPNIYLWTNVFVYDYYNYGLCPIYLFMAFLLCIYLWVSKYLSMNKCILTTICLWLMTICTKIIDLCINQWWGSAHFKKTDPYPYLLRTWFYINSYKTFYVRIKNI